MESDEVDFVFYGTPIEREEDFTSRRKKAVAEASGNLRALPPWKQEVTDEEGRRRFHGAFTGGFSAGYYNTVGSKEGWAPKSFTSSRKIRAEVKQQSILNFLDEDEKAELEGQFLGTSSQFDTFGFTAAELARKQAEKEQEKRPSAIPGPAPDEIVLPATESIGVTLLLKMGWRHGHSIKVSRADSRYDARREARKAFLAFSCDDAKNQFGSLGSSIEQPVHDDVHSSQSPPAFVLNPKQDLHGLGYDPFKHAPEFRERKRLRMSGYKEPGYRKALSIKDSLFGFKSGKVAPGFGIGALEEYDAEDEDVYASVYDFEETDVQEDEEPLRLGKDSKQKLIGKEQGVLPGFRVASNSDNHLERFEPPVIPKDFVPRHIFLGPLETDNKLSVPPPPEVPPPEDNNLKILIEGVATLVVRCGKLYEDLSREKNQLNPLFDFLNGGNGHDYYVRKLWEERQKRSDQTKLALDGKLSKNVQKMTAESRGKLLGERPLDRTLRDSSSSVTSADVHLQFNLSDTFTTPSATELSAVAKPFKDDPAKQERFEQFLKEKYQGGLRSTDSSGASNMSEAARARERLDFEAAAEAIQKGKLGKQSELSAQQFLEFSAAGGMQFTSSVLEEAKDTQSEKLMVKNMFPKREEFEWRPSPLLCKRFDIIDPYLGKPPPAPRMRSKIDSLIFMPDTGNTAKVEESVVKDLKSDVHKISKEEGNNDIIAEVEVEHVERPVDLYKAIFSDDSDDEVEGSNLKKVEDPEKKIDVASTTLNRLIAGDFLESLGKELGLEVPPELPYSTNKFKTPGPQKETASIDAGNASILPVGNNSSSTCDAVSGTPKSQAKLHHLDVSQVGYLEKNELIDTGLPSSSQYLETGSSENKDVKVKSEKMPQEARKAKSPSSRRRHWSSSSLSEDESRKLSRRHEYRSDSYSDSSNDNQDRYHSRSRARKKGSSREKRRNSRHSKHRKHRTMDSPTQSSRYGTEKERSDSKGERRRYRN
ncbi:Surp domain-containing protein/DUF1604 domain-containing protein [Cephalotus follicularis]|uniref:Surp domain-containing protein/DUF1604 domain-containing protein n=1 Tax=Cephalotus follicularis TaxID=3775 RepID=A0A1Q3CTS4_CEPFO|nr:Surp domain-containing protein/DUF1604 domain-containing protein [Cephalotus follicularis]